MFEKIRRVVHVLAEAGPYGIAYRLKRKYGIPMPLGRKGQWRMNVQAEIWWWDRYLRDEVVPAGPEYDRLRADTPLQERVAELLPAEAQTVHILHVGAGPLTPHRL